MCDTIETNRNDNLSRSILETSYFNISFDTNKLSCAFQKIATTLTTHQKKLEKMYSDFTRIYQTIQSKINSQNQRNNMNFTKINKQINENSNIMKMYVSDLDLAIKKDEALIKIIQKQVIITKSSINKVGDCIKEDLSSGLTNLKHQLIGNQQEQKHNQQQQQHQKKQSQNIEYKQINKMIKLQDFATTYKYFSDKINQLDSSISGRIQKSLKSQKQKTLRLNKQEFINRGLQKEKLVRQGNQKQNQHNKSYDVNKFIYPSLKNKEQNLRKDQERNTMKNQVIKRRQYPGKDSRHMSLKFADDDVEIYQVHQQIQDKVHALEHALNNRQTIFDQIKNKMIVLEQKSGIHSRKIDKMLHEVTEIKSITRRLEAQKNDEKAVQQLRSYLKWSIREIQQKIALKCDYVALQNEKKKIFQKICILHQNLLEKAEKGQIQKALVFLENKIKEIIILIASEQNQQRDGAMIKTAMKCLSCDKDMEKGMVVNEKRQASKSGSYSRSLTHRTRQKYKQSLKQTLTSGNQSVEYL